MDPHQSGGLQWSQTHGRPEAVKGAWDFLHEDHERISQNSIKLQDCKVLESLHHNIEVPCVVQWKMLWYSTLTSLNIDLLNDGVTHEQYDKAVSVRSSNPFSFDRSGEGTHQDLLSWKHRC